MANDTRPAAGKFIPTEAEAIDTLAVALIDGRTLAVPLSWYPRLAHARPAERNHWRLIAGGAGIHWPDIDEDISIDALLAGIRSAESPASLRKWLSARGD
jgi:hypothetical protein